MNKETDENTNGPQPHDGMKETANAPDQEGKEPKAGRYSIDFETATDNSAINTILDMTVEDLDNLSDDDKQKLLKEIPEETKKAFEGLAARILQIVSDQQADSVKETASIAISSIYKSIAELTKQMPTHDEWQELTPFLKRELQKPEYNGAKVEDVKIYFNPFTGAPFQWAIDNEPPADWMERHKITGRQALQAWQAAKEAKEAAEKINIKRANDVTYPVDKPNSNIWKFDEERSAVRFDMTAKKDNKPHVYALYSITFTDDNILKEANMSKRLSPFDKLVYMAVWSSAKMNQHNSYYVTTLSQIYYTMGNTSKPSHDQLARIYDSMRKMRSANVTLNNQQEHERYKNIPLSSLLDAPLLPFEASSMYTNGKLTDTGIVLYREPPLITFARERKQLSAVPIKYMQIPLNRTDENIAIDDYLKVRILREANKHTRDFRIIYEKLFEKCGITERRSKSRAKNKIKSLLNFYKKNSFIENYTVQSDGVKITLQSKKRT